MADSLHPVARILLGCGWAVAAELAAWPPLLILAVATATAFLFAPVRREGWRLLRRTRWLLAVLLLAYAYTVPGTSLWPVLGWASPSLEGLQEGAWRVLRLALILSGLAVFLAYTSRPRIVYGLYALCWPLSVLGFDRRAFAVRLGLTLDYVEHAPPPVRWMDALRAPPVDDAQPDRYVLQAERWQGRDSAVILAGLAGLLLLFA